MNERNSANHDIEVFFDGGWHRDRIAALFRLASRDVQAAIEYIDSHRREVEADYQRILARHHNFRYSPEVQAKVDRCREAAERRLAEIYSRELHEDSSAPDHG